MAVDLSTNSNYREYTRKSGETGYIKVGSKADQRRGGGNDVPQPVGAISSFDGEKYLKQLQGIEKQISGFQQQLKDQQTQRPGVTDVDQTKRTGAGTMESPLTNIQVSDLEKQGYTEGDVVPGSGKLTPLGTFADRPKSTATVINPETEQTETFEGDPDKVAQQVADAQGRGMEIVESSQTGMTADQNPEITRLTQAHDDAIKEVESLQRDLSNLIITDDELRMQIRAINATWNNRKDEMRDITERQIGKINTMGMRRGMRYTGGGGGVWGALVSEAERQGVLAIASLDAQQQSKVMEAKAAAREFNYTIYSDLIEDAQEIEREKAKALADLKEQQRLKEEELAQQKRTMEVESAVSQLVLGDEANGIDGITDPNLIFQMLNMDAQGNLTGDYTFAEIKAAMNVAEPDDIFKDFPADLAYFEYLKSIGDPSVEGMTPFQYLAATSAAQRAPASGRAPTADERKMNAVAEISSYLSPWDTVENAVKFPGTNRPIVGEDGYVGADGWRFLSEQVAPQLGVQREEFISNFSNFINPDHLNNEDLRKYNLTPIDIQQIRGYSKGAMDYSD